MKRFSGNKGEWSEPYVVLRLLADGRLCQADKDMLPSSTDFANVLQVVRGDTTASIEGTGGTVVFTHVDGKGLLHNTTTYRSNLKAQAERLFKAISVINGTNGAFELSSAIDADLKLLGFSRLTNPAPRKMRTTKRDLGLQLVSPQIGMANLGFSIKSELGAPPTLLNASEPTNIVYRIKGLTSKEANAINGISGPRKIMDRCRAIKERALSIDYAFFHSTVFADNLEVVDSSLPQMIADLVKVHYFEQILIPRSRSGMGAYRDADRLSKAVDLLSKTLPYSMKQRQDFCAIKIKRFLKACALGLMPSEEWNGTDDASGGYIIVLPDGRLVALYVYNSNLFEKYLYETTIFERASTSRHNYMQLVPEGHTGDYLLKLNLQIRFNR